MKTLVQILGAASATLVLASVSSAATAESLQKKAKSCFYAGNFSCAVDNYKAFVTIRPTDVTGRAMLGFALEKFDKPAEAIAVLQGVIDEGEGAYDLFASYARCLRAVGRDDDAIIWNYRTLSVQSNLVDVRGDLAKLLVKKGRGYEALALLASFDEFLESKGESTYFKAQRIAIGSVLQRTATPAAKSGQVLKMARLDGHFYTTVASSDGEPVPFMIDTGASHTTLSLATLKALSIKIPDHAQQVTVHLADGSKTTGQAFFAAELHLGPYKLSRVHVLTCSACSSLIGQSTLSRFDLKTKKVDGIEFMEMSERLAE